MRQMRPAFRRVFVALLVLAALPWIGLAVLLR
jgi:hypothetical protein